MLKLSQVTLGKVSTGHVINLASNDVQRFDKAFSFTHVLWICPLHLAVVMYLIYREVGWPAFLAMVLIIVQVPFQILSGHLFEKLRCVCVCIMLASVTVPALPVIYIMVCVSVYKCISLSLIRLKSAQITDKRVLIMNEVIIGIRVIKMYAWEYAFKSVVSKLRK